MAIKAKDDVQQPEGKEEPVKTPEPDSADSGKGLEERLDRLEEMVKQALGVGADKKDGATGGKPATRTEREASIAQQVSEEVAKLRDAEKHDEERSKTLSKIEEIEAALKEERQPQSFSRGAKFWFGTGTSKKAAAK